MMDKQEKFLMMVLIGVIVLLTLWCMQLSAQTTQPDKLPAEIREFFTNKWLVPYAIEVRGDPNGVGYYTGGMKGVHPKAKKKLLHYNLKMFAAMREAHYGEKQAMK